MKDKERFSIRQYLENKLNISSYFALKIVEACNFDKDLIYSLCEEKFVKNKYVESGIIRYGQNGFLLVLRTKESWNFEEMKRHSENRIKNLKKSNKELEQTYDELIAHARSLKERIEKNIKEIGIIKKQFELKTS